MISAENKRKVYRSTSSSFNYLSHHKGNGIEKSLKEEFGIFLGVA